MSNQTLMCPQNRAPKNKVQLEQTALLLAEVDKEAVVPGVLPAEGLALPRAAPDGLAGQAAAIEPARDPLVPAHGDAAPQRGLLPRRAAPGAAHAVGGRQDVDVVQPLEDHQEHVRRQGPSAQSLAAALRWRRARRRCLRPPLTRCEGMPGVGAPERKGVVTSCMRRVRIFKDWIDLFLIV